MIYNMSGSLLQLTAPAAESSFLLGSDVTFWRVAYSKHTAFAIESCRVDFRDDVRFDSSCSVVIPRNADLVYRCYLQVTLTKNDTRYPRALGTYYPAEALVKACTLMFGGTVVDKHTCDWFRIHDSMHRPSEESSHYRKMTNFDAKTLVTRVQSTETLYLPLIFSFNRHSGLAIPLICLYNSEVKLVFDFASHTEIGVLPTNFTASLYCDGVYLDAAERARLFSRNHSYLIEQVQRIGRTLTEGPTEEGMTTVRVKLDFRHPVKAIYFVLRSILPATPTRTFHARYVGDEQGLYVAFQPNQFDIEGGYGLVDVQSQKYAPVASAKLTINGVDRQVERPGTYYSIVQPAQYTRRSPLPGIYMFSFALHPEELAPSGTCDMTNMESELVLRLKRSSPDSVFNTTYSGTDAESVAKNITNLRDLQVYAVNYNLLNVFDGKAETVFGSYV